MSEVYEFCLRCHRKLKNEEAKRIGYGRVCYEKAHSDNTKNRLFIVKEKKNGTV